ncbi:hypothetical protein AABB02_02570 [Streptomyces rimosus]|uniref:hypothetical protein n=1 Tax=Streptomyces rimosus TaxID=1927 RepID=UPI0031D2C41C
MPTGVAPESQEEHFHEAPDGYGCGRGGFRTALIVGGPGQAFAATKTVQWKIKATGYCLSSIADTVSTAKCNLRITN